jgi:sporulation-control protein spo0M
MKGTTFLKPLEYNIIADGQSWHQGDKIFGKITVKNHSADKLELPFLIITLATGHFKKIKSKDKKAWESIALIALCEKYTLAASEEREFSWEFVLPEDCPITDKNGSVYLLFKDGKAGEELWPTGQLELVIEPKIVVQQFLEIMENFLRFKVIQKKFSKGMVEIKLNPPTSRELSHVESLVLRMKEVDKTLDLEYIFNMNVFETVAGNVMTQKKIKQVDQRLTSKQYYSYGDFPNQDFIIKTMTDVIKEATPKFLL